MTSATPQATTVRTTTIAMLPLPRRHQRRGDDDEFPYATDTATTTPAVVVQLPLSLLLLRQRRRRLALLLPAPLRHDPHRQHCNTHCHCDAYSASGCTPVASPLSPPPTAALSRGALGASRRQRALAAHELIVREPLPLRLKKFGVPHSAIATATRPPPLAVALLAQVGARRPTRSRWLFALRDLNLRTARLLQHRLPRTVVVRL